MRTVHVVVPAGIDDPARPSGGNTYDRRVIDGLAAAGWDVREHPVPGNWPEPDDAALRALADVVNGVPAGSLLLVDGLIGSAARPVLAPAARCTRLVVLVHTPLGAPGFAPLGPADVSAKSAADVPGEGQVLAAAAAVVTTSEWTRRRLLDRYPLSPDRVHVAHPGADPAPPAHGSPGGGELLCVAAVTRHKGHDLLLAALAGIAHLQWRCVCVGSLARQPGFVADLQRRAAAAGLAERITFTGPRTGEALAASYIAADLVVLPSRGESYGMVIAEALAHSLPVLATDVGGVREALGPTPDTDLPGLLVPVDDAHALGAALARWLADPELRRRLRAAAGVRRATLPTWDDTTVRIAQALSSAAGDSVPPREHS